MSIRDKYNKNNTEQVHKTAAELLLEQNTGNTDNHESVKTEIQNDVKKEKSNSVNTEDNKYAHLKREVTSPVKATVVLEKEQHTEIKVLSARMNIKMADIIAEGIDLFLEKYGQK